MTERKSRPVAFRLDDERVALDGRRAAGPPVAVIHETEEIPEEISRANATSANGSNLFLAFLGMGLGGLITLAVGLWVTRLVEDLFSLAGPLGYGALALSALALAGLTGFLIREIAAVRRQKRIGEISTAIAAAFAADDAARARSVVADLARLFADRPETAHARSEITRVSGGIVDGRDLIAIAERELLAPLDARARRLVADAAKRVSTAAAIAPHASLGVVFAFAQLIYLARRISDLYGGRPGLAGFWRVLKNVGAHVAISGGMAAGDSLLQQIVGHGVASRISARLGEGVLNGLLTTRVGIAAIGACRPAPFLTRRAATIREVAPFLFSGRKDPGGASGRSVTPDQQGGGGGADGGEQDP